MSTMLQKENLFRIIILIFGILVSLLLAEIFLRVFYSQAQRYEGARLEGAMSNETARVLVLGDSFLTPQNEELGMHELLERGLESHGVKILNTAQPGFGPVDYWIQYSAFASSFKPDLVVLFYYVGNDITNIQYSSDYLRWAKLYLKPLLTRSALFNFLNEKRNLLHHQRIQNESKKVATPQSTVKDEVAATPLNLYFKDLARSRPNYVLDNLLIETEENLNAWRIGKSMIDKIRKNVDRKGTRLVVVILPSTSQVGRSHFDFYSKLGFRTSDRTLTENRPQELLLQYCQENGVQCLDLLPILKQGEGKMLYKGHDDHFNSAGNEMAARESLPFILGALGRR